VTPWLLFLPRPTIRRVFNFPSNADTQTTSPRKQTQPGDFPFLLQHTLKVTFLHPSQTLILLSTHIRRSPSVLNFTVTPWFALTRTQRPQKTTESYICMEPEKSLPNESHCDPQIIPPHTYFLDFWIFLRVVCPTPPGLGVAQEEGKINWPCLTNWPLLYYTNCTKINLLLKNISDKLAKFEQTNAILVEYIQNKRHLNVSQKLQIFFMVLFDFQHVW